ncbi:MAG: hypothetical protein WAM30_20740 [Candidatus Dormiibacterota bacterium]
MTYYEAVVEYRRRDAEIAAAAERARLLHEGLDRQSRSERRAGRRR